MTVELKVGEGLAVLVTVGLALRVGVTVALSVLDSHGVCVGVGVALLPVGTAVGLSV